MKADRAGRRFRLASPAMALVLGGLLIALLAAVRQALEPADSSAWLPDGER